MLDMYVALDGQKVTGFTQGDKVSEREGTRQESFKQVIHTQKYNVHTLLELVIKLYVMQ